jgi:hypothetical protein
VTETTVVPLRTGAKVAGIVPTNIEEAFRLASAIAKSGMAPRGMDKPETIMAAMLHGMEIGLPPMTALNKIAVVNGRPTVWGDAVPALLWSRGFKLDETVTDNIATCTVIRPDGFKITRTFSETDARKAGLWGKAGPWQQYPSRMLQMRARGLAARDGAADALAGMYLAEEAEDIPTIDITPRKSSAEAKRDGTKEAFDGLMLAIEQAPEPTDLMQLRQDNSEVWRTMPSRWATLLNEAFFYKAKDFGIEVHPETGEIVEQQAAE